MITKSRVNEGLIRKTDIEEQRRRRTETAKPHTNALETETKIETEAAISRKETERTKRRVT